ncbi:hypothetical protein PEL8287_03559 [Roseovarius litorisediminis]|uniref:Acetolactate synthase n=1 Tax=Roseovarius litorisediminis TaxID=1312363 RepID=A0A1Y5TKZ1_9RHOB|nr:DUF6497 family protein [Roseovarius litorisediminis]SLN64535.1 hypothetical protein PEL8287_03559 [Roseovarius litorisediminis]
MSQEPRALDAVGRMKAAMITGALLAAAGVTAGALWMGGGQKPVALADQGILLPSGLEAELQEMLWNEPGSGLVYRFRFVAPAFKGGDGDFDQLRADLEYLCNEYALARLSNLGPVPRQVIISLADRPSEFGVADPNVTQVFEAYSIENDTCIWEMF